MRLLACLVALVLAPVAQAGPEPEGTWALEMRVVSAARVPVIGDVTSTTVTVGLLETVAGAVGWSQRYTVCDVHLAEEGKLIRSSLPRAFVQALPVRTVSASLEQGRYVADLGTVQLGFDAEASAGSVPLSAEHPAVLDFEGDGYPGFTVHVDVPLFPGVRVYLIQASSTALHGELVSPDRVVGRSEVSWLEQHVIGASLGAFARSPVVRPVNDEGFFQLLRVPDGTACAEVQGLLAGVGP